MAIHIIRKYRRSITIAFVLSAGVPLVFFTGSGGFSNMRGQDPYAALGETIAQVGPVPITAGEFMNQYDRVLESLSFGGEAPEVSELIVNGTVEAILESLIQDALIRVETQERQVYADVEYLKVKLKEDPYFQTEDGAFDQLLFNRWVEGSNRARANWNEVYDDIARNVNRNVYTNMMVASARVLGADLRARYEAENTQIKVAYVAVDPTKEFTDEELSTLYEANLDRYQTPAERTAAFVALPLDSADPESVDRQSARASAIAESAGASGDLAAVAAAEGLELKTSSSFSFNSTDIDNVPPAETALFRRSLIDLAEGAISEPIEGRTQIFVAKIVGVIEPVQKTLEEVREDVVRDAQVAYRGTEEFEIRAHEYMDEIESNTEPLSAVSARYPELSLETKTSLLFSSDDFLFTQGIFWGAEEAHARLSDRAPGTKIWMKDFRGTHYVLELTESVKPDAQAWSENETAERDEFRKTLLSAYENERRQDYLLHLSQKADAQSLIQRNWQAIFALLGLDDSPDTTLPLEIVDLELPELADPGDGESSEAGVSSPEAVTLESSGDTAE